MKTIRAVAVVERSSGDVNLAAFGNGLSVYRRKADLSRDQIIVGDDEDLVAVTIKARKQPKPPRKRKLVPRS